MEFFVPDYEISIPLGVIDECRRNRAFHDAYFSRFVKAHQEKMAPCIPCTKCPVCSDPVSKPSIFSGSHWSTCFDQNVVIVDPAIPICGLKSPCRHIASNFVRTIAAAKFSSAHHEPNSNPSVANKAHGSEGIAQKNTGYDTISDDLSFVRVENNEDDDDDSAFKINGETHDSTVEAPIAIGTGSDALYNSARASIKCYVH